MAHVLVKHKKLENYSKWREVFESANDLRAANGEKSAKIFRDADASDSLVLLFEWDSLDNARRYTQSPELKAAMEKAGLTTPPEISFLDEA